MIKRKAQCVPLQHHALVHPATQTGIKRVNVMPRRRRRRRRVWQPPAWTLAEQARRRAHRTRGARVCLSRGGCERATMLARRPRRGPRVPLQVALASPSALRCRSMPISFGFRDFCPPLRNGLTSLSVTVCHCHVSQLALASSLCVIMCNMMCRLHKTQDRHTALAARSPRTHKP